MTWRLMFLSLLVFLLWLSTTDASHFRGGVITWRPTSSNSREVTLLFRLAFRRSSIFCDEYVISSGVLIGHNDYWNAECIHPPTSQCPDQTIGNTSFYCTDFSESEDWSMGEKTISYNFPSDSNKWLVSYTSCCWIALTVGGAPGWRLSTIVDLNPRYDTGEINSSPVTTNPAIIRVRQGCAQSTRIPLEDPDGDTVRCRWSTLDESNIPQNSFPHGTLDEENCILSYNGSGYPGDIYAVTLTLEDFPAGTTDFSGASSFSSVGMQFLVMIINNTGSCSDVPVFTGSTPQDGECSQVQIGSIYNAVIEVESTNPLTPIDEIVTSSPTGMQISPLVDNGGIYHKVITWSPTEYQNGTNVLCFKAVDSYGAESEQRCVTILVGLDSFTPNVILESRRPEYPVSEIREGFMWWSIQFDHVIKKPREPSFISLVLSPSGQLIYQVNTSSSLVIIGDNQTVLYFAMPFVALSMAGSYAILIDSGAVVGLGCLYDGPPTPGITSTNQSAFNVSGICNTGYYLGGPGLETCIDVDECGDQSVTNTYDVFGSCHNTLTNVSGTFTSPYHPSNYSNNEDCTWLISVTPGLYIKLSFDSFHLEDGGDQCPGDYVEIFDGASTLATSIIKLCSNLSQWCVHSSSSSLLVHFFTDGVITNPGFSASYETALYQSGDCYSNPSGSTPATAYELDIPPTMSPLPSDDFELQLPAQCSDYCTNTPGSFYCSCDDGYQLQADDQTCEDINECLTFNGGCSHNCTNEEGSFYCTCTGSTRMTADNRTCNEHEISVLCGDDYMTVVIKKIEWSFVDASTVHLLDPSCTAQDNGTHFILTTSLDDCETTRNETSDSLIFLNEVSVPSAEQIGNLGITRSHNSNISIYCQYPRKQNVTVGFIPDRRTIVLNETGFGTITFTIELYRTENFTTPYSDYDYPISVDLDDYLYIMYSVESSTADIVVKAEKCFATPGTSVDSLPQYVIIENGCPLDDTMEYYYNSSSDRQQIKIQAFRFYNDYNIVYIHCELVACHGDSLGSSCSQQCPVSSRRKKRELEKPEQEYQDTTSRYDVTAGPLIINNNDEQDAEEGNSGASGQSNQQTVLIGGVAAAGGFALIVFVAMSVVCVKYRTARLIMKRNKAKEQYATKEDDIGRTNAFVSEEDMVGKDDAI